MVKEDIETVIDRLYDLIKAGNKVTVKEAALALSLTDEQVEKLAMILEESDLIEVQYTLAGSVLMPKKVEQPNTLIPLATPKQVREKEVIEEVKSVENVAEFIEKDFIERLSKAEKALAAATSGKDLSKKDIVDIRKELKFLQQKLKNFQANIKKIEVGEVSFEQQVAKYQTKLAELEKTSKEGGSTSPVAFLANFLAFLIAWMHSLMPSGKQKAQARPVQKPVVEKREVQAPKQLEVKQILPSLGKMEFPKLSLPFVSKPEGKKKSRIRTGTKPKRKAAVSTFKPRKKTIRKTKHIARKEKKNKSGKKGRRK